MKSWKDKVIPVQDKGSEFVVLNTNNYVEKVKQQKNISSFDKLDSDPSSEFKLYVIDWTEN